jgi:hypothetical protein
MGYYMQFFNQSADSVDFQTLHRSLKELHSSYCIKGVKKEASEYGELYLGEELLGEIEINRPGDGLFDEEKAEFQSLLNPEDTAERCKNALSDVQALLNQVREVIAVCVLWQGRENGPTMDMIDPLWQWLSGYREGLLLADGEGFYNENELILALL